jgi:primary-amine oxidase
MATQQIETQQDYVVPTKQQAVAHPLCPLSGEEISQASAIIRSTWPAHTDLRFKTITLSEPAKKEFVPYLDAEHAGQPLPKLDRKVFVAYYIRNTVCIALIVVRHRCSSDVQHRIASTKPLST